MATMQLGGDGKAQFAHQIMFMRRGEGIYAIRVTTEDGRYFYLNMSKADSAQLMDVMHSMLGGARGPKVTSIVGGEG